MIKIVTGGIDTGKTRKILSLYTQLQQGDGIVSIKIYNNHMECTGYEIMHLATGEKLPLAFKEVFVPIDWDELYRIGPFRFSKKAFDFADEIIDKILSDNIEPVFIDEIGPLELSGRGFHSILERVLKNSKETFLSVRTHCVEDVVRKYSIDNYSLIPV